MRTLAVAMLVALAGCSISEDQERQLGAEAAQEVNAQLPIVTDPVVAGYVSSLGQLIAHGTERSALDWHFYVVDSRQVNAFALPGGYVYVNRGLLERTRSMDELAGVLGHEIGHVVLRHSVKQMEETNKANAGLAVFCNLSNFCGSHTTQAVISIAGSAWFARHSRADEAAADSEAVINVVRARISPDGIPSMFETLLGMRDRQLSSVDGWFASHPLEEDRIRATEQIIGMLSPVSLRGLTRDTPTFEEMRARLSLLPPPPAPNDQSLKPAVQ